MKPLNLLRTNKINIGVDHILNDYSFFSTSEQFQNQDNFYYYDQSNGLYVLDAEIIIVKMLKQIFGNSFKYYSHIRDVITEVQRLSPIISIEQIDPPNITNHKNGLFFHNENKLIPHSPKFYTTKQIPTNYIRETNSLSQQADRLALLNFID
jgi:phage/plasmid-associated DNA primase